MTLAQYSPTSVHERAMQYAHQDDNARRIDAIRAARDSDGNGLWNCVLAQHALAGHTFPRATLRTYRAGLDAWLAWAAVRGVSTLRPGPRAGQQYLGDMRARGLSVATIRVRVAAVRKLYAALRDAGVSTPDPFAGVKLPTDPTPAIEKRPPYTPDQVDALLAVAEGDDRALILLCAHAGLRVTEALNLTWADVDLNTRLARVNGKGGKLRTVPLSGPTIETLRALGPKDGHVLGIRAYTTAYDRLNRLADLTGVEWRGFHAGRKHAGTQLYQHVPLEHVQRLLGHASPNDTLRYVQVGGDATRDAVAALWG